MKTLITLLVALTAAAPASADGQARADAAGRPRRPDRWQIQVAGGQYLWDVRLVRLSGDSLVVSQSDTLVAVPLANVGEIRLMRATEVRVGGGAREALGALAGTDDEVFDLTTADAEERRRIVRQILVDHPPQGSADSTRRTP
jgi:hypothetical protein